MATMNQHKIAHERMSLQLDLVALPRTIWNELPLFALIGFLLTIAVTIVSVVTMTVALAAPVVSAMTIGPIWIAATSVSWQLLGGDNPGMRGFFSDLQRFWSDGIVLALPLAIVATLLLGTVALLNGSANRSWFLAPIAADAIALILLTCGALTVFPIAVATDLHGRLRWSTAIALAGRSPVATLGLIAAALLLILSIRYIGPFLAVAAAGPYCLLVTATVRQMLASSGAPDDGR